jgi:hypothetical protein
MPWAGWPPPPATQACFLPPLTFLGWVGTRGQDRQRQATPGLSAFARGGRRRRRRRVTARNVSPLPARVAVGGDRETAKTRWPGSTTQKGGEMQRLPPQCASNCGSARRDENFAPGASRTKVQARNFTRVQKSFTKFLGDKLWRHAMVSLTNFHNQNVP